MNLVVIIIAVLVILLAGIVFFGAPFVPTKKKQIKIALDLLDLKKGNALYDLGAGDGRVALAAAERGIRVVGYELNIFLVLLARFRTRKYKNLVNIRWQNYWSADFSKCDGVYIFSAGIYIRRLDMILGKSKKTIRLASNAFAVQGRSPIKQSNGVFLYHYGA